MTRVMAFLVVFLTGTACHREIKTLDTVAAVVQEHVVTESVTTAPTERVTERWHFSVTPGVGRALPGGGVAIPPGPARSTPSAGSSPAGFPPSPGLGYAVDEYERITEKLDPVATTKTTGDKNSVTNTVKASDKDTDVGFSLKFYLLAGGLLAAVVALGIFLSHSKLVRRLMGVPL